MIVRASRSCSMRTRSAVGGNSLHSQTQEMLYDDDDLVFLHDLDNHYAIKLKLFDENAKCRTQELAALADPRNAQRR